MSLSLTDRVDLIIDLEHPAIAWQPLHHGLEALDTAGYVPHHLFTLSDHLLARVDFSLGPTFGAKVAHGGAWLIAPKSACSSFVALAGYLGAYTKAKRLASFRQEGDLGIAGPFVLDGEFVMHRLTMTLAALYALRERGYRRALLPAINVDVVPVLAAFLGSAILSSTTLLRKSPPRVVVCASGNGSNLQALIDAMLRDEVSLDLRRVVVNRKNARVLQRAQRANIPTSSLLWRREEQSRAAFDNEVQKAVAQEAPDLILLLGWMHLLPANFVQAFPDILNIHPAYLPLETRADQVTLPDGCEQPAFRGPKAIDDALAMDTKWIGATVHRVSTEVDRGEVLARIPLACEQGEDEEHLRSRLQEVEHRLLVVAIQRWLEEAW